MCVGAFEQLELFLKLRRLHLFQIFFQPLQPLLNLAQIADHEIELDILDVAQGVNFAHMGYCRIVEGANHVGQRVDLAQVAKVSRLLQCFLANGADIDVFDRRMSQLLGIVESGQAIQAIVGYLGHSHMRLARVGKGVFGERRLGQNAEQRCFAYLRQANDAGFHRRSSPSALS